MVGKVAATAKAFGPEVERCFCPFAAELDLAGPERDNSVTPTISFVGSGLRYLISYSMMDQSVTTEVEIDVESGRLVGDLEDVAVVAGVVNRNSIPSSAVTVRQLRRSLESQAECVRRLHPIMVAADREALMRKSGAKQWLQ